MCTRMKILKAAGAVVNGFHRDTRGILELNFPCFSYGRYAQDQGPRGKVIDYRVPIEMDGVRINPGDIIFGDLDGVLVIPKEVETEVIQKAYEKACEVRAMAVDGEHDFTELASKYSDDSEITYSFGKGEAESAYEEAAFNLATDEVSQVIQCERGYYIIKCTNTLDREETDANKLKIVEERKREVFGQEYDSFVNTLVRQLNDKLWDEITLITDEQVTTDNFFDVYARYFPEE